MRSDNPIHSNCSYLRLIALMGILLLLASCSPLPSVLRGAGGQDQGEQGGQQAAQPSQQGAVGQSGDNGPGSDEGDVGNAEVIPPVAGVCPQEPQQAILFINHTFDWSPNRDKSIAEIKGHTGASEPCPLTIKRQQGHGSSLQGQLQQFWRRAWHKRRLQNAGSRTG
jgi:hypothetical protein